MLGRVHCVFRVVTVLPSRIILGPFAPQPAASHISLSFYCGEDDPFQILEDGQKNSNQARLGPPLLTLLADTADTT
jgi:hypothetical protein